MSSCLKIKLTFVNKFTGNMENALQELKNELKQVFTAERISIRAK